MMDAVANGEPASGRVVSFHFDGVPLSLVEDGPLAGWFVMDSRILARLANRPHKHVVAACRTARARYSEAEKYIVPRVYHPRARIDYPFFLLAGPGIAYALLHMKNRLGLNKDTLMARLERVFDRAECGQVDADRRVSPAEVLIAEARAAGISLRVEDGQLLVKMSRGPLAESLRRRLKAQRDALIALLSPPAPDSAPTERSSADIRPPEKEPELELTKQPEPPPAASPAPSPVIDVALQRRISAVIRFLSAPEVGAPTDAVAVLDGWNRKRIEDAVAALRSLDEGGEPSAS